MDRFNIFCNLRETSYVLIKTIVAFIIVYCANFPNEYRSFSRLAVKTMINALFQADALAGMQDQPGSWLNGTLDGINLQNGGIPT